MHLLHVLDTFALFVTSVHAPYIYVNLMFSIREKRPKLQKQFPKVTAGNKLPLQHTEILIGYYGAAGSSAIIRFPCFSYILI